MDTLSRLAESFGEIMGRTGPYAPAVLFFASFVEYVFPPFPGDMIVMLGAWYAIQGVLSWPASFAAVTGGAIFGSWVDYRIGAWLGLRLEERAGRSLLDAERLARFEAVYRRWGVLLLAANRFLPGVRGFLFLAAGASRIPQWKVLLFGGLSACLWNALLLALGAFVARNLDELSGMVARYTAVVSVGVALACAILAARWWLRRGERGPSG